MTVYTLNNRLLLLDQKIQKLYCYLGNNPFDGSKDIEIKDPNKGFILTAQSGDKFKITVSDDGTLQVNPINPT